ncbi:MAG: hypothetical protein CMM01_04180 [Rhodopirellula sp.]|nr:hypothetical protein [Rhodopirellula sp.]
MSQRHEPDRYRIDRYRHFQATVGWKQRWLSVSLSESCNAVDLRWERPHQKADRFSARSPHSAD